MNDVTSKTKLETKGKRFKSLLFLANWLFVVFLSKKLISHPTGSLDFVLKNIGTIFRRRSDDARDDSVFLPKSHYSLDTDNGYFGTGCCYQMNKLSA
jgi:hypothetical protein